MSLYVGNPGNCPKVDASYGTIYQLLGRQSGNTDRLSVEQVEIAPKKSLPSHLVQAADECQVILEGQGKIVVGDSERAVSRIVSAGDAIKIPAGKIRTLINGDAPLKLFRFFSPAFKQEDCISAEMATSEPDEKGEIYVRRKEGCFEINTGSGELIYELIGIGNGDSQSMSVALVEIKEGSSTDAHFHPVAEESYIILEGEGILVVDGETRKVTRGDVVKIPAGKVHQIFSLNHLKFFCTCKPAWKPDCMIKA